MLFRSSGGIPLIYLGDEVGTLDDHGYVNDPGKAGDSRWVHRPARDEQRYADRRDPSTDAGRLHAGMRHLIALREALARVQAALLNRHALELMAEELRLAQDAVNEITGEFTPTEAGDAWAIQREDGSWLFDGLIPVPELKDRLDLKELPEEDRGRYNTLAGMIMLLLGRLPRTADVVEQHDVHVVVLRHLAPLIAGVVVWPVYVLLPAAGAE